MAKQAYLEWMPVRSVEPLYRTFKYGELAELIMIDTRLEARDEQLNDSGGRFDRGIIYG